MADQLASSGVEALPERADIAIVGAGVIGLSAAAQLAVAGHSVVVLDAGEPGSAASTHNAGQFRPAACVPLAAPGALRELLHAVGKPGRPITLAGGALRDLRWPLAFASWARTTGLERRTQALAKLGEASVTAYESLERRAGRELLVRAGALDIYETEAGWSAGRKAAGALAERGFEVHPLSRAEVLAREPSLRGAPAGAAFFPGAAHVDPNAVVATLLQIATEAGAQVIGGVAVQGIDSKRDYELLRVAGRELRAESVVIAAGVGSRALLEGASRRLMPLLGGRGFGIDLASDAPPPARSMIFIERHLAVTPLGSGVVRMTTGMDIGAQRLRVRRARFAAMQRAGEETLGLLSSSGCERWVGVRPLTPDGLPIVGPLPGRERIVVAAGHGMLGLTYGPATGELVARIFDGGLPAWAAALHPGRFGRGWSARSFGRGEAPGTPPTVAGAMPKDAIEEPGKG